MSEQEQQEEKRPYISYSRINTFQECPWKWALTYVHRDVVNPIPMWAGVGGTAFHEASEILDRHELWKD